MNLGIAYSTIDCNHCKNYWMVKNTNYEKRITNTHCQGHVDKSLFDHQVKTKLGQKCHLLSCNGIKLNFI